PRYDRHLRRHPQGGRAGSRAGDRIMLYVNPQASASFRTHPGMPNSPAREAQALQEFERLFLFQMLKEMRKTIPDGGLFQGGMKQEYFEEMMDDFLAGEMAASGQLGIARQMAAELHAKRPADVPLFHSGIPLPSAPA